jgi:ubiquinone/menaquinone biosynthesis C-methylase UbiE
MTVKEHYDNYLGNIYSWSVGDFDKKKEEFKQFLIDNGIKPLRNKFAIDLGAGHGIQSVSLAELGFQVLAVDFNQQLIDELKVNTENLTIDIIKDDIRNIAQFATGAPELITCCSDTLLHLDNKDQIKVLISDISNSLCAKGKLILSFRDYSYALKDTKRFIPVKSDETKILTCILDFEDEFVNVTDLLYEKINGVWMQKVSSYKKVRMVPSEILKLLEINNFKIEFNNSFNGMTTIIAVKEEIYKWVK